MDAEVSMNTARVAAARKLGKLLAMDRGRKHLAKHGYVPETPIVTTLEGDSVASVMTYINSTYSANGVMSVLLAVYWPDKDELRLAAVNSKASTVTASDSDSTPLGDTTSLGMLFDTIGRRNRWQVDTDGWSPPVELHKLPVLS